MEFRILGPLEVVEDGQPLDVGGAKQRTLLACLLLHVNEAVSTDRLLDALWEDAPPARAHKALQVYVSQLRKLIGTASAGDEAARLSAARCRRQSSISSASRRSWRRKAG